jgi:hypothetical protein
MHADGVLNHPQISRSRFLYRWREKNKPAGSRKWVDFHAPMFCIRDELNRNDAGACRCGTRDAAFADLASYPIPRDCSLARPTSLI